MSENNKGYYYGKASVHDAVKALVEEIANHGFTCDTMASEKLWKFYYSCQLCGNELVRTIGRNVEELDRNGAGRNASMTYALMAIGSEFGEFGSEMFHNAVAKEVECEKKETVKANDTVKCCDSTEVECDMQIGQEAIYVKKTSVEMPAIRYMKSNYTEVIAFVGSNHCDIIDGKLHIKKSGFDNELVSLGEWIVKDEASPTGFTVCDDASFWNRFRFSDCKSEKGC